MLSGYRIMWMVVLFDLPVGTSEERYAAAKFRNFLLDEGFLMSQFSVYAKLLLGRDKSDALLARVRKALPEYGKVHIMSFTDKQYSGILTFYGTKQDNAQKTPSQFEMF
ncbi:MAG: CRISPR-associated endonuclease Cas2 [Alphaproteobacteria bacterium]|nr:CRISPR-associated endonuclease Cas2 [Alphaproteobacteria bacterium]